MADISLADLGKAHGIDPAMPQRKGDLSVPNPLLLSPLDLIGYLARRTTGDLLFPMERLDRYRQRKALGQDMMLPPELRK